VRAFGNILQSHVQHSIIQSSTHQELQTQVVDTLGITESLSLLSAVPLCDQSISECQTGSSICSGLVAIEHRSGKGSFDMANDLLLEFVFICEGMSLELLPCCALRFGDRSYIIRYSLESIFESILKVNIE
jgi:hypothetical protein